MQTSANRLRKLPGASNGQRNPAAYAAGSPISSRDHFLDERGLVGDDLDRPTRRRVQFLVGVDAEQVIQRSTVADRRVVVLDDVQRGLVGLAEDHAALETAASDDDEL